MDMTSLSLPQQYPVMPDFTGRTAEFSHTIDSAIDVLDALGIAESRLTLQMSGPGRRPLEIVRQSPAPGAPLNPSTAVTLWISGFSLFDTLPMPMRESGGEAEIGTRELCGIFDDPLQKAAQKFRAGFPLFNIGPEKHAACRRWIALFGLDSENLPDTLLYPLALVAPTLARVAGREVGVRLLFLALLGLPIHGFKYQEEWRRLEPAMRSALGIQASRLGCDLIAGDRQAEAGSLCIEVGPVSLETYRAFQTERQKMLLQRTMELGMSAYQKWSSVWLIEDMRQAPRLGIASQNSCIGLNFHLGKGSRA